MVDWIKAHPYLSGSLVLGVIVLFLLLRGRSSATVTATASGPSEALQAANLQAQTQQQAIQASADTQTQGIQAALIAKQIDAGLAQDAIDAQVKEAAIVAGFQLSVAQQQANRDITVAGIQTQGAVDIAGNTNAAAVAVAQSNNQATVQVATIGANRDITVAGIQSTTLQAQYEAALQATRDTNATSLAISGINANRDITMNQSNNAATIDITRLQTDVQNNYINTAGIINLAGIAATERVQTAYIDAQQSVQQASIDSHDQTVSDILSFLGTTAANRGGEAANLNVVAVSGILGNPSVGAAAVAGNTAQVVNSSPTSIIGSLGGFFANANPFASTVAKAVVA